MELAVGVETVDDNVMKTINKQWQNQDTIRKFIENAKKAEIKIKICLILGLPGEQRILLKKQFHSCQKLNQIMLQFQVFAQFLVLQYL